MHGTTLRITINGTCTAQVYGMIPHKNGVRLELAGVVVGSVFQRV